MEYITPYERKSWLSYSNKGRAINGPQQMLAKTQKIGRNGEYRTRVAVKIMEYLANSSSTIRKDGLDIVDLNHYRCTGNKI